MNELEVSNNLISLSAKGLSEATDRELEEVINNCGYLTSIGNKTIDYGSIGLLAILEVNKRQINRLVVENLKSSEISQAMARESLKLSRIAIWVAISGVLLTTIVSFIGAIP